MKQSPATISRCLRAIGALVLLSSALVGVLQAKAQAHHESVSKPTLSNVPYGTHERQVLDFWTAASASRKTPAPLVMYIHGGSWKTGSKELINGCVDVNALLKAGISVVAINYRYVSHAGADGVVPPVKAPLDDAARALQFVRSKADEWHVDKERIAVTGESAGGCSALWLAYHNDMADAASSDPVARESTRVFCAGVRVPQTSLDPKQMREWMPRVGYGGHAFGKRNFQAFLDAREELLPWIEAYSPYAHLSVDDPPVSLYYNKYLEKDLNGGHSPQFAFNLQKRCKELELFCDVLYDRAPGYEENEATFYLIKMLTAPEDTAKSEVSGKDLPAFKQGARLVFIGDSITDMKWGRNEKDRNHYLGHSYVFLLAARLGVDMPGAQLDFYNRGISGNTVSDLRKRWQKDAVDMKPDILTILIGTNDVGTGLRNPDRTVTPAAFETDYRHILDASRKANPDLRLVLMDPFVLPTGRLKPTDAYRARRDPTDKLRVVVAKLAREYNAVHIKTQGIFDAASEQVPPENWIWDGVHPLPQGHELIARHWMKAMSAR